MSKNKSFVEWVKYYEKKSKCKFIWKATCYLTIAPDGSFMQWRASNRMFIIYDTVGNSKGWELFVNYYCLKNKIKWIVTYTYRKPNAFIRRFGAKILRKYVNRDNVLTYVLCREVF